MGELGDLRVEFTVGADVPGNEIRGRLISAWHAAASAGGFQAQGDPEITFLVDQRMHVVSGEVMSSTP